MNNMWCENKIINNAINILIFLVAINFLHYGQLILPIICLLIFIGNDYKINIKNKVIFITLCLFAISFFAFSYNYGIYSVMGFCLPMAYFIGSNVRPNNENVKKLIYLIALGMACHVILNCIYDNYYHISTEGVTAFYKHHHYDIWLLDEVSTTGVATNYPLAIGCLFYLISNEKNIKYKYIGLIVIISIMLYEIVLGRRTPFLILLISFFTTCLIDIVINNKNKKVFLIGTLFVFVLIFTIVIVFYFDFLGLQSFLHSIRIIQKFNEYGLNSGRIELLLETIALMPNYMWGRQEISSIIGEQVHNLWLDIYDFSGIISFAFFVMYTELTTKKLFKVIIDCKRKKNDYWLLYFSIVLCCLMEFLIEPIMTGASIFMICTVIIFAAIESLA